MSKCGEELESVGSHLKKIRFWGINIIHWYIYSRTSLIRTPKGQRKVSILKKCPLYRGHEYFITLRTVPTKYKGFCARLGPRGKSRSLQGLLESTKKNMGSHAFFEIISLESQQKCWHQHFSEKSGKRYFFTDFLRIRLYIQKGKHI